jgi:hypothetical protein
LPYYSSRCCAYCTRLWWQNNDCSTGGMIVDRGKQNNRKLFSYPLFDNTNSQWITRACYCEGHSLEPCSADRHLSQFPPRKCWNSILKRGYSASFWIFSLAEFFHISELPGLNLRSKACHPDW